MHADPIASRGDDSRHMRAMSVCVFKPGAGEVTAMRQPRRQLRMVTVNAGIGNGHQRAKPGPPPGIGIAEPRCLQRRLPLTTIIFGGFIEGWIGDGSRRWRAANLVFRRIDLWGWRRSTIIIIIILIGESVRTLDKDNRLGGRQTAAAAASAQK